MIDQDAIGAMGAGFHHLIGVEHEILAQHRQMVAARAVTMKIEMALERRRYPSTPTGTPRRRPHRPLPARGGSKSARINPFDGEAFLTSAISA